METILIPLTALSIPIIIVPTALGFRHARLHRELKHAERMRALELGRTLPGDYSWWSPARLAAGIGVAVPLGSLLIAWMVSDSLGFNENVWISAAMVALGGVACGTFLTARQIATARPEVKPAYDPDAFDVVSSRG